MASDVKNQFWVPVQWWHARISSLGGLCSSLRQRKAAELSIYPVSTIPILINFIIEEALYEHRCRSIMLSCILYSSMTDTLAVKLTLQPPLGPISQKSR